MLITAIWAVAITAFAQGPTDTYYLTAGDQRTNITIKGTVASTSPQAGGSSNPEYAIAVYGDIRTDGPNSGPGTSASGSQYNLNFVSTGVSYPAIFKGFNDGTTDGMHNFGISYGGDGYVWSTMRDWSAPIDLFKPTGIDLGITYDPANNSIWVANFGSGTTISDYSLTGTFISSFDTHTTSMTALAFDPGDGTLWFGSQTTPGWFYQYSQSGVKEQSDFYSNLVNYDGKGDNYNTLGGEFNLDPSPAPEPFTMSLGAAGIALAVRRRTKARRA